MGLVPMLLGRQNIALASGLPVSVPMLLGA